MIDLWWLPGRAAKIGTSKGGRRPKSGRKVIEDAAVTIIATATTAANPAAAALGLGPCLLGKGIGKNGEGGRGRPRKQLTGALGPNGESQQFAAMEYHITWCAAEGKPPPGVPGLGWSHRCHNPGCVEPKHGLWELWEKNRERDTCAEEDAGPCPHDPPCVPWPGRGSANYTDSEE